MSELVVLDFDGTIYRGDSMLDFARFLNSKRYYISIIRLLPILIWMKLRILSNDYAKKRFIQLNFKNLKRDNLEESAERYFKIHLARLYPKAVEYISKKSSCEVEILIVSGSFDLWLKHFAAYIDADLICNKFEYSSEGINMGSMSNKNIVGEEKKRVLENYLSSRTFDKITGFGNQKSDLYMASLCQEFHLNEFK